MDPVGWSPDAACAMNAVIVSPASSGLNVSLGLPAASTTIIVSPTARLMPRTNAATIPEIAAGTTTLVATCIFVLPRP